MQPEPQCKLRQILRHNTDRVALPDTGSMFNSTNNKEPMTNAMEASQPMTSRTNVGQCEMKKCGETPELSEEMWLDEKSMITVTSFCKTSRMTLHTM